MVIENGHDVGDRSLKLVGRIALFTVFLVGLTLSVVFPYGIGFAAFLGAIALVGAVCGVVAICYGLLKDILGRTATFGYTPNLSYMAGKKSRKKREEASEDEEKKDK
jgi:hypothetical protein